MPTNRATTTAKKRPKSGPTKTPRKTVAPTAANGIATAASAQGVVRVRMYRTGLGDCFLLTFPRGSGSYHMLVDCGVFFMTPNEKKILRDVAADIRTATGGTIDVLVGTHEHYDHLIGFKHAKDIFAGMTVKEVWLSWIERPGEPRAAWLRALEQKLKLGLKLALQEAKSRPSLAANAKKLKGILEFGGNPLAADYSEQMGEVKRWIRDDLTASVKYLEPHGQAIELVPGVRVYPLGPPTNDTFFRRMNDSKQDPETYHTDLAFSAVPAFLSVGTINHPNRPADSQAAALAAPFERRWQIATSAASTWRAPVRAEEQRRSPAESAQFFADRYGFASRDAEAWRRIDDNWLAEAENLALQLDSLTNNSSLALAIEVGSARKVILMAADAQVGNWLYWHEGTWSANADDGGSQTVTAADLLGRTVLYKVGHHGSHNATLKQKGLSMMTSNELVAMIPVNEKFATEVKGWQMPYPALLSELTTQTKGRVIRSDHGVPAQHDVDAAVRTTFFQSANETTLYAEYLVAM